jgi:hypothetical protein
MSKNTKIILGSLGGTLLLCIGLVVAFSVFAEWQNRRNLANMRVEDPTAIAQIANTMADYELPPHYEEALILKISTTNALYIFAAEDTPDNLSYPRITLMQFPPHKYASALAAREKMRQAGSQFETEDGQVVSREEVTTTIRGQEVGLTIYHSVNNSGEEQRSIVSDVFAGKEGFLQLIIEGPLQGWDEEMIDAFIQSIR